MYLHLIAPDPKFPKLIRSIFKELPSSEHIFVVLTSKKTHEVFLNSDFLTIQHPNELSSLLDTHGNCEGVLLHGILLKAESFVRKLPASIKVGWLIWGYEIYRLQFPKDRGLLDPETHAYAFSDQINTKTRLNSPLFYFARAQRRNRRRKIQIEYLMSRIKYIVTQFESEFNLLRAWDYTNQANEWHFAPVLRLEDLVGDSPNLKAPTGNDIQVGNSASQTNNHVDVFKRLASEVIDDRKVIVPLSYGDSSYRKFVVTEGRKILGESFIPITDFMPLDQYLQKFKKCSITILNNHRQQAVGNTIASLWAGRTVYLGNSAVLSDYQKVGLPVYSFEKDFDITRPTLTSEEHAKCRNQIEMTVGTAKVKQSIELLLHKLSS
jgi:dTDP-N-acetylfucosamine:lipid II N-acetylfucosaminyltransferase